jgi:hypothetical protein
MVTASACVPVDSWLQLLDQPRREGWDPGDWGAGGFSADLNPK